MRGSERARPNPRSIYSTLAIRSLLVAWFAMATYLVLLPTPPSGFLISPLGHFVFAGALLAGVLWTIDSPRKYWPVVVGALVLAVVLEFGLDSTPDPDEFLADMAGSIAALALIGLLWWADIGRVVDWLVTAVLLAGLIAAVLGPVRHSDPVQRWSDCRNASAIPISDQSRVLDQDDRGTRILDGEGEEVPIDQTSTRTTNSEPGSFVRSIRCEGSVTAVVQVVSEDAFQEGPTRILTLSEGIQANQQNFGLGQEGTSLSVRVRTIRGELEGFLVDDVFENGETVHIAVRFRSGTLDIFVNGGLVKSVETQGKRLSNWSDYPLSVGDELTGGRHFIGVVESGVIEARWWSDEEISDDFSLGVGTS